VKVNTSRFGELTVNGNDIITFEEGLLGFENLRKFFVIDPGDSTLILWLQSIEDAHIAFPIIEPKIFKPDYVAILMPSDMKPLELNSIAEAKVYTILTIPSDIAQMSANLKAPIIINKATSKAKQIVLQDNKLTVRHAMYLDLKRYISRFNSDDSRRTNVTVNSNGASADAANVANSTSASAKAKSKESNPQ
jgi:flagellar assembly factor FliW